MDPRNQVLFLELNEINFEFIMKYIERGELPHFGQFFASYGYVETESEQSYEALEPWIQWVTAHTGLSYSEHGIFRLGDIVDTDIPQIWEQLEAAGLRVGAVSPMNAKFRLRDPAFFIPDPWTNTQVVAAPTDARFYRAIRQAVSDNASGGLKKKNLVDFIVGGLRNASVSNYPTYAKLISSARSNSWSKALVLDQLLADLFARLVRKEKPDFASLFLNAGAHIQHHYIFNSAVYEGSQSNPSWYVEQNRDPILDAYRLYDNILGQVVSSFPKARIMLATGLHQTPYEQTTFYWRLVDHAAFLSLIDVSYCVVEPRMSRDFLVSCTSQDAASSAEHRLHLARTDSGEPIFTVDNRGSNLFVTLSYPNDIPDGMAINIGNRRVENFRRHVAFVAIKNGEHSGIGYFSDSGNQMQTAGARFPLATIPTRVREALHVS